MATRIVKDSAEPLRSAHELLPVPTGDVSTHPPDPAASHEALPPKLPAGDVGDRSDRRARWCAQPGAQAVANCDSDREGEARREKPNGERRPPRRRHLRLRPRPLALRLLREVLLARPLALLVLSLDRRSMRCALRLQPVERGGYMAVTRRLQGGYKAVTWMIHGGYMAVTCNSSRERRSSSGSSRRTKSSESSVGSCSCLKSM